MKKNITLFALAAVALAVSAKIPPPTLDDAAKAKAAEAAAKTAWQAKVDAFQLCKVQDKLAAKYGKAGAKTATPATGKIGAPATTAAPA